MDKEFIQKIHDANLIIQDAQKQLQENIQKYFEKHPEHKINVNLSCKSSIFYGMISDYPEIFSFTFKIGNIDITIEFKIFYTNASSDVHYTIKSSLDLPDIYIAPPNKCITNLITINAMYKGNLDRKIFLHFEKDEPNAIFKVMK